MIKMVSSFFRSRKAQGLSLNVIIIAVIAIVVLLVLIFVFTGKVKIFGKTSENCESRGAGAKCVASEGACLDGVTYRFGTDCAKRKEAGESGVDGPVCCVPLSENKNPSSSATS
jgi:hypothetical protein